MVLPVNKEPRDPETTYSALEQEAFLSVLILVIQIQMQMIPTLIKLIIL